MIWQFTGVGPHNKGAELMFLAMREQVLRMDPGARMAMNPGGSASYRWRSRQGLWQVWDDAQSGRLAWLRRRLFHQGYRERFGLIPQDEVEVLLDASGFAYGDAWPVEWIEATAARYERIRRNGTRIILMPQAFGPFTDPRVAAASRRVFETADLVFARDGESRDHLAQLGPGKAAIQQAPDFTAVLKGKLPEDWQVEPRQVAVIPNRKMLDFGSAKARQAYVEAMVDAAREAAALGYSPFVLPHEEGDGGLADEIAAWGGGLPVVTYEDPLHLKGILGRVDFTIGSRFHGLVNSLSQGVPAFGTSWSHKYHHLYRDFGVPELLASVDSLPTAIRSLREPALDSWRGTLAEQSNKVKAETTRMWERVEQRI